MYVRSRNTFRGSELLFSTFSYVLGERGVACEGARKNLPGGEISGEEVDEGNGEEGNELVEGGAASWQ